MYWKRMEPGEIQAIVFDALSRNLNYRSQPVLGLPGSFLDRAVFPPLAELRRRALLTCFMENPNHIGCHTMGESEPAFRGTQEIEKDLLRVCAEEILGAPPDGYDAYVASGGTESNIQAIWTFRNLFRRENGGATPTIGIVCSEDTHYSIPKAADLLTLPLYTVSVNAETRAMEETAIDEALSMAIADGISHMIVVLNLGTTMFGSVDDADPLLGAVHRRGIPYKAHVDAAFGGFVYPFAAPSNQLSFRDERLTSFTLDAHKMLQAPYGTGIHIIRKGHIANVLTESATYVPGLDCTLSGSRSGTNAVAVWMILMSYGSEGGAAFCAELVRRAARLSASLTELGVRHYRQPHMNVVTMRAADLPDSLTETYMLVPESGGDASQWRKIVVMDHVTDELIDRFLSELQRDRPSTSV